MPDLLPPPSSQTSLVDEALSFPFKIEPTLSYSLLSSEMAHHVAFMETILRKCIPSDLLQLTSQDFKAKLLEKLPFLLWNEPASAPECLDLCFLTHSSKEEISEHQIVDILRSWIIPGKITPLLSFQVLNFRWDLFPSEIFLVFQAKVLVKNEKELSRILSHLPSLSMHLLSGLKTPSLLKTFFLRQPLLENVKSAEVYRDLVFLLEKFPSIFDSSLFSEMGHFFSLIPKSFLSPRTSRLLSKIIAYHFLMKSHLIRLHSLYPGKRHLELRFLRTKLRFFFGSKPVLGLVLGIAPLDKHEFFEEEHILEAVQSLIPDAQCVQGSFYSYQGTQDSLCTLYIELEKKDGSRFDQEEMSLLKTDLEHELKRRIEKLVPSIFMIRNEEETMKSILLLSQELKYLSDLPQVMISLDKQTPTEIIFTIIVVRLSKPGQRSLSQSFYELQTSVQFVPDRLQHVGFLRKNHPKEANVFHLKLPKESSLLRPDYSVNFYLARKKAADLLLEAIGPFRDYNGGMILKQGELFYEFKEAFSSLSQKKPELLENFFFSLNPIETQATLPLSSLQILFRQFIEASESPLVKKNQYFLKIEEKKDRLFAMVRTHDASFKEEAHATLVRHELWSKNLIHIAMHFQGSHYTGFILAHFEAKKHQAFIEAIHEAIKHWKNKLNNLQIANLSFSYLPPSLDPRIDPDDISSTMAKMLFEGLTRFDAKGKPSLAAAQSVEIASDLKHYVFKLKKSLWSNSTPVTAYDFEYSWKKILSPHFSTPFSYLFHPIKNAERVKKGQCPIEDLGVKALDISTLSVELECPTPEFLELTALALYSPVPQSIDNTHPDWGLKEADDFVCNGPFLLKKTVRGLRYELAKNPLYWDNQKVKLEQINVSKDSSLVAHSLFKNEETDWLGMPLRPWEPFFEEHPESETRPMVSGVYWAIFNTEKFPFHNHRLRQAFFFAVSQKELVSRLPHTCQPAASPLPRSHTMNFNWDAIRGQEAKALELFELALQELGITRKQFPLITLTFANTALREKAARYLIERWKSLFHIPCRMEKYEYPTFFSKIMKSDFQLATLHWKSWIDHPFYTLSLFKNPSDLINFAKWSHPEYQDLLAQAQQEIDPIKKIRFLTSAEELLIQEAPLIPLYHEKEKIIKKRHLKEVIYSNSTGYFDLKNAYIER